MKRKIIILFITVLFFGTVLQSTFVRAQTPTPATQTPEDAGIVVQILKQIFSIQGGTASDVKSIEEYQREIEKLSGTPGAQSTIPPGQSPTPGPSPTPDENSSCNTSNKGYYACKLVEEIRRVCGGRVNSSTMNCLDNLRIPGVDTNIMGPAVAEMKTSAVGTGALQCVSFVKAALYIMRKGDGDMLQARGNAIDWLANNPSSFAAIKNDGSQRLQDGDVPIWKIKTFGHIAIYIGNGQIAEGNFDAKGKVNIRAVNESSPGLVGWLRPL